MYILFLCHHVFEHRISFKFTTIIGQIIVKKKNQKILEKRENLHNNSFLHKFNFVIIRKGIIVKTS